MTRWAVLAVVAAACGNKGAATTAGSGSGSGSGPGSGPPPPTDKCTQLPFADSSPVPEASGAAWLSIGGKPALAVISDSGNDGAYAVIDPDSGDTLETGKLALGKLAGQDFEGAAAWNNQLVTINSAGWIRVYQHDDAAKTFTPVGDAYALGPVTLPAKSKSGGNAPPEGDGMVCDGMATNCGRNYEGLCLVDAAHRPAGDAACVGFAASKADGSLYCLTEEAGKLVAHHDRAIPVVDHGGALADCAFADDGSLWAGSNLFDFAAVYEVKGWSDPATAKVVPLAGIGLGFPETLAVKGDVFYRMSDTGGAPSLLAKYRCAR